MKETLDLLIIGAGPAGLSAAGEAARAGLSYLVIEKGTIANTIRQYPVGRTLFSTPNELEMKEGSLKPVRDKPTREELLSHYIHFVLDNDLQINAGEEVVAIEQAEPELFVIKTKSADVLGHEQSATYRARRLLFAVGAMDHPRRLNVPGEDLPKVFHRFVEPYPYIRKEALVVGGGNSAAEAALFLSEEGRAYDHGDLARRLGEPRSQGRGDEALGALAARTRDLTRAPARHSLQTYRRDHRARGNSYDGGR
jgi:thioredoxin reductase (NADPH)